MSWLNDPVCPICGKPHVDGVSVTRDRQVLFLCLDCAEETFEKQDRATMPTKIIEAVEN